MIPIVAKQLLPYPLEHHRYYKRILQTNFRKVFTTCYFTFDTSDFGIPLYWQNELGKYFSPAVMSILCNRWNLLLFLAMPQYFSNTRTAHHFEQVVDACLIRFYYSDLYTLEHDPISIVAFCEQVHKKDENYSKEEKQIAFNYMINDPQITGE